MIQNQVEPGKPVLTFVRLEDMWQKHEEPIAFATRIPYAASDPSYHVTDNLFWKILRGDHIMYPEHTSEVEIQEGLRREGYNKGYNIGLVNGIGISLGLALIGTLAYLAYSRLKRTN